GAPPAHSTATRLSVRLTRARVTAGTAERPRSILAMQPAQLMPSTANSRRAVPPFQRTKWVRSRTSFMSRGLFEEYGGFGDEQPFAAALGFEHQVPLAGRNLDGLSGVEAGLQFPERDAAVGPLVDRPLERCRERQSGQRHAGLVARLDAHHRAAV